MNGESPRPLSLVRVADERTRDSAGQAWQYPFEAGVTLLFLGEIPNMPGHCVVVERGTGRIHVGYHTENFVELDDSEV